jgi:hypothetical protein
MSGKVGSMETDAPAPWAVYPDLNRYTMGWRMGAGEEVMARWWTFVETLPTDFEARLAYFRRYRPAPYPWGDLIHKVLHSDDGSEPDYSRLRDLGLIASDVAYSNWLQTEDSHHWVPWHNDRCPLMTARYTLRPFSFWARQPKRPDALPEGWGAICRTVGPDQGLLTLAQMLWKGRQVQPPWQLGLTVDDFADSFALDVGYVDAFRLWLIQAVDDIEQLTAVVGVVPEEWKAWLAEHGPEH